MLTGVSSNTTKAYIANIVDQSLAKGIIPIVAEITPITIDNFDFFVWRDYNPKVRAVAAEKDVPLAYMFGKDNDAYSTTWVSDMRLRWRGGTATPYHSGEQLYLSDVAYQKMAEILFDVIDQNQSRANIVPIIKLLLLD